MDTKTATPIPHLQAGDPRTLIGTDDIDIIWRCNWCDSPHTQWLPKFFETGAPTCEACRSEMTADTGTTIFTHHTPITVYRVCEQCGSSREQNLANILEQHHPHSICAQCENEMSTLNVLTGHRK